MAELELDAWQREVDAWVRGHGGYFPPLAQVARLTEETGEVARAAMERWGGKTPRPGRDPADLGSELGDLLLVAACLATQGEVSLADAARRALSKARGRDSGRFEDLGGTEN
ncbi:MAG: MazG nucleotide pyrophosphohydrolase domain-containing protein [Candidatus Sericytochromatia bacterium]|nr:MazG nucleotide pyrophosphohydrolase domain-containing protein [Candidatus Sericytochromatia bacterium]